MKENALARFQQMQQLSIQNIEFSFITATLEQQCPWQDSRNYCCHICQIERPANCSHSKHGSKKCVLEFGHYCIFLATDIGAGNYRYFVAALFVMSCIVMPTFLSASSHYMKHVLILPITSTVGSDAKSSSDVVVVVEKALQIFIVWAFLTMLQMGCFFLFHLYCLVTGKRAGKSKG